MINHGIFYLAYDSLYPSHGLDQERLSCQLCTYEGHADFGYVGGHFMGHTLSVVVAQ